MVVDVLCRASTQGGAESQMNTATTLTTDHDRTIIAHKSEAVALQGNMPDYPEFRDNQTLSIAGKRAGLDGNRSGLFREAIRIILEMLEATGWKYPRFVIWENVPGALSSNGGKDFETVLNELLRLTGTDQFVRQRGKWGALQGTELWPTDLSTRNTGECPNADAEYTLAAILADDPPTRYFLSVRAMDGILSRASRRGKQLPELLVTAIAGMKEWWRQNPLGGGMTPPTP